MELWNFSEEKKKQLNGRASERINADVHVGYGFFCGEFGLGPNRLMDTSWT